MFLSTFANPKDKVLCVLPDDGGYPGIWKEGFASLLGLRVVGFPFSKRRMNITVNEAVRLVLREKPRIIVFGASLFLFPHPLREIAKAAPSAYT